MSDDFSQKFIAAVEERIKYYNSDILPELLESYRLFHTCVKNIIDALIQRSIIKPDPYKLDKKISDIELIPNDPFIDSERSLVIGTRISDYEAMLDFITTYYKFSVENLTFPKIKKIADFNACFNWHSFTPSNPMPNTRGFALLVNDAKHNAPALIVNTLNDSITKCDKAVKEINAMLKDLNEFQKEVYKCYIRKDVFDHPKFDKAKANESVESEIAEIKKVFPQVMGKTPYYTALIEEIAREDLAPNCENLQAQVLKRLEFKNEKTEKKQTGINTKDILMTAIQSLSALGPQFETVSSKLADNHRLLQSEHRSFWEKFKALLRKAFGRPEPPVIYEVSFKDSSSGATVREKILFNEFYEMINKKIAFYNSFSLKTAVGYQKIEKNDSTKILEFLNKQISEAQRISVKLNALDEYFKTHANNENKKNVKGLMMELTSIKNTIVNTNQHRADYIAYIEEQSQMQKLGIKNEA